MAAAAFALPCLASSASSWACCLGSAACQLCCSLASCFGCRPNAAAARVLHLALFFVAATAALVLRYWGESILSQVTAMASAAVPGFCSTERCWGAQGAYR
jgi:hypothetical protein